MTVGLLLLTATGATAVADQGEKKSSSATNKTVSNLKDRYYAGYRILPLLSAAQHSEQDSFSKKEFRILTNIAKRSARHPGARYAASEFGSKMIAIEERANWQWFAGLAALDRGDEKTAEEHFRSVKKSDSNYLRSEYQIAMLDLKKNRVKPAEIRLKAILGSRPAPEADLEDLTKLALGRIWYEQKRFRASAAIYRTVNRESRWFDTALFEQAWPMFMAGYPNHALGALHSADSPFFEKNFNPEIPLLKSIVLYWMCLYRDSNFALEEFIARHSSSIENLDQFLSRQRLNATSGWELFENFIAGVSSESLGIDHDILMTAAESAPMIPLRLALAKTMKEQGRLAREDNVIPGERQLLDQHLALIKNRIGQSFVEQLQQMREHYAALRSQADFLYVELLTSEKDKLMGKNDHLAEEKFAKHRRSVKRPAGWGKRLVAWAKSDKNEYWWDEVGYYVDPAKPQCKR